MQRFIVLRILQGLLAVFVISIIVFALSRVAGDPAGGDPGRRSGQGANRAPSPELGARQAYSCPILHLCAASFDRGFGSIVPVGPASARVDSGAVAGHGATIVICPGNYRVNRFPIGVLSAVKKTPGSTRAGKCSPY